MLRILIGAVDFMIFRSVGVDSGERESELSRSTSTTVSCDAFSNTFPTFFRLCVFVTCLPSFGGHSRTNTLKGMRVVGMQWIAVVPCGVVEVVSLAS